MGQLHDHVPEDHYVSDVISFIREKAYFEKVTVVTRNAPYTTKDGRECLISRLVMEEVFDGSDDSYHHEMDLLIFTDEQFFVIFDGTCDSRYELPLDVRDWTDTATFEFDTDLITTGNTFKDTYTGMELEFTDSEHFKNILDPFKLEK